MNVSELNDLDINNIASWPLPARVFVIAVVFVAVLGLGYWFDIKDQQLSLVREQVARGKQQVEESLRLQREAIARQRSLLMFAFPAIAVCMGLIAYLILSYL